MASIVVFFGILAVIVIGVISPGPSFLLVSRIGIYRSRREAIATAIGMGAAGAILAILALAGVEAVLIHVAWLYRSLKIAGGFYLLYLGYFLWRGASAAINNDAPEIRSRPMVDDYFCLGLMTELSNPKAVIGYVGDFAALLPPAPEDWMFKAIPLATFCVAAGWYSFVAITVSCRRPRDLYLKCKLWIDRGAASMIAGMGFVLMIHTLLY